MLSPLKLSETEFDPAAKPQGTANTAEFDAAGATREPWPCASSVTVPKPNRPRMLAVTEPVGTGPPAVAGAAAMLNVTGSAKTEGLALEISVRVTGRGPPWTVPDEVLPL